MTIKGNRTYAALIGVFLAQTSSLFLSLGVIDSGLQPDQIANIVNWLDGATQFLAGTAAYFRSLATKK